MRIADIRLRESSPAARLYAVQGELAFEQGCFGGRHTLELADPVFNLLVVKGCLDDFLTVNGRSAASLHKYHFRIWLNSR
jgi:hypothetical protein